MLYEIEIRIRHRMFQNSAEYFVKNRRKVEIKLVRKLDFHSKAPSSSETTDDNMIFC